jgi:hypothetical protein
MEAILLADSAGGPRNECISWVLAWIKDLKHASEVSIVDSDSWVRTATAQQTDRCASDQLQL